MKEGKNNQILNLEAEFTKEYILTKK